MSKIVAIVQARMGSERFPGKVLKPISGTPMVGQVLQRLEGVSEIGQVAVATSVSRADDDLVQYLNSQHPEIFVYRGSETNVLSRYLETAERASADVVVRVTADCPLIMPDVTSSVIRSFLENRNVDYVSNTLERTFPQGLDTEVFTFQVLKEAHQRADTETEREHVTPYIYFRPKDFRISQYTDSCDRSSWRWTVDYPADLDLVAKIYSSLSDSEVRDYEKVVEYFDANPDLLKMNNHLHQRKVNLVSKRVE